MSSTTTSSSFSLNPLHDILIPFGVNLLSLAAGVGIGFGYLVLQEKISPPVRHDISDITKIVRTCARFGIGGVTICFFSYLHYVGWKPAASIAVGDAIILLAVFFRDLKDKLF